MRQDTKQQQPIYLEDATGDPLIFADKAAFVSAGNDIVWKRDGVALSSQPSWDMTADSDVSGLYHVDYVAPPSDWVAVVDLADSDHVTEPLAFFARAQQNDSDTLASIISASGGAISSLDGVLSTTLRLYEGDSIAVNAAIPENILALVGAVSLSDLDSIDAGLKLNGTAAESPPDLSISGGQITTVSDSLGNRVIRIEVNEFPSVITVGEGVRNTVISGRIDVRVTKGQVTRIASKVDVRAEWSAKP